MKKLLLLLITIIPVILFSQPHAGIGAGYDFKGSNPIANVYAGYSYKALNITAELRPPASRKAFSSAYSGIKLGFDICDKELTNASVIASVGYFYNKVSADKTNLNNFKIGYSLKGIWYLKEYNGLYFESFLINKSVQLSFGMHATLN